MITSTANSQIKNVINLIKKSKERKNQGLFVVEGRKMFEETPAERIDKVYISESFINSNKAYEKEYLSKCSYEIVSDNVFAHMSDTKTPQGILALVKIKENTIDEILASKNSIQDAGNTNNPDDIDKPDDRNKKDKEPLILVLENIQDPGNLGTMIRTAEGAGVTGIVMTADTVDIYNPKVIRSTMGAMYRMKFAYVSDIEEAVIALRSRNITTYAAHLKGEGFYDEADYTGGTAFLIGNEGNGLTDKASEMSDKLIKIPMEGALESLNAAVSAAILMYEASRQRRSK